MLRRLISRHAATCSLGRHRRQVSRRASAVGRSAAGVAILAVLSFAAPGWNALAQAPDIYVVHPGIEGNVPTQDSTGFIWIPTTEGAVRYDGRRTVRYRHNPTDSTSLGLDYVQTIIPASNGGVWIGTYGDGVDLFVPESETFRHFLPGVFVSHLIEDERGILWVGTEDGVFRLDPALGTSDDYDMGGPVSVLYQDPGGTVWAGLGDTKRASVGMVQRYDSDANTFVPYLIAGSEESAALGLNAPSVWAFHEDRFGTLWIGTQNLLVFDRTNRRLELPNVPEFRWLDVLSLHETPDGMLYIGTFGRGLVRYELQNQKLESVLTPNGIYAQAVDATGILWFGTYDRSIVRYDPATNTNQSWRNDPVDPNSPPFLRFTRFFVDRSGMIWTPGVAFFDPIGKGFLYLKNDPKDPSSLGEGSIDAIEEGPDGSIWLGSGDTGLYRLDPSSGHLDQWRHDPNDRNTLASDEIWSLLVTEDGTVWVGSWNDGLSRLDPATGNVRRFTSEAGDLIADNIPSIQLGVDGAIEVLTILGHQRYDDATDTWETRTSNEAATGYAVSGEAADALLIDSAGRRWLGTEGSGLYMYPPFSQRPILYFHEPGMTHGLGTNDVEVLFEDSGGRIWIGTGDRGLERIISMDPEDSLVTRTYGNFDGLPATSINSILEDGAGRIWVASDDLLSVWDPQTDRFRTFDSGDGLKAGGFSHGAAYYSARYGLAYFGYSKGLLVFNPEEVLRNGAPPRVVISGFRRFNSDEEAGTPIAVPGVWKTGKVTLTHTDNIAEIDLATTTYRNPERQQFAYRLEGFSDTWFQLGTNASITLTNLSPGDYRLHVRAANDDGVWGDGSALLELHVLPPWWRSRLAYFVYGFLFLASVFGADRFQRRRLILRERRQAELREAELKAETAEAQAGEAKALADKAEAQANEAEAARRALQAENERKEIELEKARELEDAFRALEAAHNQLKATQDQLIHSEKMASLGLLTAGIAHEIKNPLNFVNNFAELNAELAEELQQTAASMEVPEEFEDLIADVLLNAQQIAKHGKRADTIVASMMEHAVATSGARELHDVNAQLREYANLSYHAYQANKGALDCAFEWDLHEGHEAIPIVAQELGRVWLNLFNNAYDAVRERVASEGASYKAVVRVATQRSGSWVEVRISDNGPGVAPGSRDKIFDPFYTTKPTGFGNTGLGLSLTHDIVSKGHQGSISVEETPGGGATFVVRLPDSVPDAQAS